MREIEFRGLGLSPANKESWFYGDVLRRQQHTFIGYTGKTDGPKKRPIDINVDVDPKTIGQFTGFKDSRGIKIYDGDILQDADIGGYSYVKWSQKDGTWLTSDNENLHIDVECGTKVIGNIHEHSDLLHVPSKKDLNDG